MSISAKKFDYKGKEAVKLICGKYEAIVAPFVGSNVIRFRDTEAGIEVFRYDEDLTPEDLVKAAEIYGFPTLYLPNRLAGGVLKVSDATYSLPINDVLGNHIHGFLHKRAHKIEEVSTTDAGATVKTSYTYDENDEFFQFFPVSFKAEFTISLEKSGLNYSFTMTNTSDKQLPYGVCNHTTIKAPFLKDGKPLDVHLYIPVGDKWELSRNFIPTGGFLPQTNHDRQYLTGSLIPVKQDIDNDVFFAERGSLDGNPFHGAVVEDGPSGKRIVYEVCDDFKFWIVWNDHGEKGFFCPEPSTWIIDAPNQPLPADESGYRELAPGESNTLTERIYTM